MAEVSAKWHLRFHSSAVGRGSVRDVSGRWPALARLASEVTTGPGIAVGPDDAGVGVAVHQGVEVPQVVGRLEDPPLGGLARLQGLEGGPVLGVGRRHVRLLQPPGVAGHVGLGLERHGAQVVHEQRHALLGQGGPEGVHGLQRRVELHQPVEVLGVAGDPGILGRPLRAWGAGWDGPPPTAAAVGPWDRVRAGSTAGWCRSGAVPRSPTAPRCAPRSPRGARSPSGAARCGWSAPRPACG